MTKKESLMQAAKELFAEYGYERTTFKKISDTAGVALGLLSHHYGSKENLFLAAALEVLDKQFEYVLRKCSAAGASGLEKTMLYARSYLDFAVSPHNHYRLLPLCTPHQVIQEKGKKQLDASLARFHHLLEQFLEEGRVDGSVAATLPSTLASSIGCTLVGLLRMRLLFSNLPNSLEKDTLQVMRRAIASSTATPLVPENK